MADAQEPQPGENDGSLLFRQPAADCLSQRIEKLLGTGEYNVPTVDLTPDAFKAYGKIESGAFVPFWHGDEAFDQFTRREAGIDRPIEQVVMEAVQKRVIEWEIPISESDREKLPQLATTLFTADEIDQLQSYALLVENEMGYALARAFEEAGTIKKGSVPEIVSPMISLREEADEEIIEFNEAIRNAADAVYGSPDFYPEPERALETVQAMKKREVLPQEPTMISITKLKRTVWGSTISGEAVNHDNRSPVRSILGSNNLVVMNDEVNQQLTSILLEKRSFLRYLLGSVIIDQQFKKMDHLKYTFRTVRERVMSENKGEKWPFDMPAKKPSDQ